MPGGKLDSEILADEFCAVLIHGLDQLRRLLLAISRQL
jgi:hypothetical protein